MIEFDTRRYYKAVASSYDRVRDGFDLKKFIGNQINLYELNNTDFRRDKTSVEVAETLGISISRAKNETELISIRTSLQRLEPEELKFCKECVDRAQNVAQRVLPEEEIVNNSINNELLEIFS